MNIGIFTVTMKLQDRFSFLCDVGMLLCFLERWCPENNILCDFGEAWRPDVTEEYYRSKGLSTAKINVHGERRAIDINFYTMSDMRLIAEKTHGGREAVRSLMKPISDYWLNLDPLNVWGGVWENPFDPYHFQRRLPG